MEAIIRLGEKKDYEENPPYHPQAEHCCFFSHVHQARLEPTPVNIRLNEILLHAAFSELKGEGRGRLHAVVSQSGGELIGRKSRTKSLYKKSRSKDNEYKQLQRIYVPRHIFYHMT